MPTALITGASSGLGAEFARQLAERGYDLILVARDSARLEQSAAALRSSNRAVEVLPADLATDDGCAVVSARLADPARPVDVLVNNAGIGLYRRFGQAELADEERQLDVNVRAVLRLSHAAVRAMTSRRAGHLINVSSVAGFVPRRGNATYAASKAWVTLFTEGLGGQLAGTGVQATAICPGFTRTEFHQRAGATMSHVSPRMWLTAADVVREGLADAFAGAPVSVPSRRYKILVTAARLAPRPVLRAVMARRGF
jgi:short-subunit dehydrogenase